MGNLEQGLIDELEFLNFFIGAIAVNFMYHPSLVVDWWVLL